MTTISILRDTRTWSAGACGKSIARPGLRTLAPVAEPVAVGPFTRRRWHLIGSELHPAAAGLRARSAGLRPQSADAPTDLASTAVLLGNEFRWQDNAMLLDGIAATRRDGGRLVLLHLGAGGASLLQVATKEDPGLETLSIELPEVPSDRALRVAVTLANSDGAGPGELQVDNSGRVTRIGWQPVELPAPPAGGNGAAPRSIVVTGGLGGLGIRAASVLAKVRRLHPLLVDTTTPDQLPADTAEHLRRLRSNGTGVTVLKADITDQSQITAALSTVDSPPISGVLHCAGLLQGGPLARFTSYDLARAQMVKVDGLRNVLAALDAERLRHLITFGSITAETPHRSMACYALANELLRRATLRAARELPRCSTVAAQWSLWSGAGMAYQAGAVSQARRMGMSPVSLRAGMTALLRLLSWPQGPASAAPLLLLGEK